MGLASLLPVPGIWEQIIRIVAMLPVLWYSSQRFFAGSTKSGRTEADKARNAANYRVGFRVRNWMGSIACGGIIFLIWVGPDLLFPNYRHSILFQNPVLGYVKSSMSEADRHNIAVLALRTFRASVIVPIVEELFWRGWLMRWLVLPDFQKVALGAYTPVAFWTVAALFAAEHGPYWDVGLLAGIIFNLWMIRTRSLGDLIVSHAVANACLSAYVMAAGRWEYWQ
jgi:uncharacterized protein